MSDTNYYHGTSFNFGSIDLSRGGVNRDFGIAFYLTKNEEQASEWAESKLKKFLRGRMQGKNVITLDKAIGAYVKTYNVNKDKLDGVVFEDADLEWASYILAGRAMERHNNEILHDYIEGPMATMYWSDLHSKLFDYLGMTSHKFSKCSYVDRIDSSRDFLEWISDHKTEIRKLSEFKESRSYLKINHQLALCSKLAIDSAPFVSSRTIKEDTVFYRSYSSK